MNSGSNWTVRARIIGGFAAILTFVAILTATSSVLLQRVSRETTFLSTDALPGLVAMGEIGSQVQEIQIKVLRVVLATSSNERTNLQREIGAMRESVLKKMDEYKSTISLEEDRQMFAKLETARDNYVAQRAELFKLLNAGKEDEGRAFEQATLTGAFLKYQEIVDELLKFNESNGVKATAAAAKAVGQAKVVIMTLSFLVLGIGIVFAAVISRSLNRALLQIVNSISESTLQVSAAAGQVSTSSQHLAEGASEQAASLEETSSSLEEMSSMTRRNSESADKANQLGKRARATAESGAVDVQAMTEAMDAINTSGAETAKIMKTIDEIAFQTNILALNAAVEAARAGEAGMGFAVVADEVRNLAQRSAQAAKETSEKIQGSLVRTAQGVEKCAKVSAALSEIATQVREVDQLIGEVAAASREQSQGISQINTAISQMDKVTQSNAANAEEGAAAAEELSSQAVAMQKEMAVLSRLVEGNKGPGGNRASRDELHQGKNGDGKRTVECAAIGTERRLGRQVRGNAQASVLGNRSSVLKASSHEGEKSGEEAFRDF
ncbi:MAG: MCP four helix bundle domain-containing protein [Verrucomicrobiales bacterium]|nr:MCP four helix bundle domain-containing protein [Verrucomicrobiales bacterium]